MCSFFSRFDVRLSRKAGGINIRTVMGPSGLEFRETNVNEAQAFYGPPRQKWQFSFLRKKPRTWPPLSTGGG